MRVRCATLRRRNARRERRNARCDAIKSTAELFSGRWFREHMLAGSWLGRMAPQKVARANHFRASARPDFSREGGLRRLLSGRWLGRITLGSVVPRKLLSGRWLGRITLGKVVRGNHSPESGSAELILGKRLGKNTLWKGVRPNYFWESASGKNYSPGSGSAELLSGRWFGKINLRGSFGRESTLGKVLRR